MPTVKPDNGIRGSSHATLVDNAIRESLDVTAGGERGDTTADHAELVVVLCNDIGLLAVLEALRDAAENASHVALGGESDIGDPFHGLTSDDCKRVEHAFENAIKACGGEV